MVRKVELGTNIVRRNKSFFGLTLTGHNMLTCYAKCENILSVHNFVLRGRKSKGAGHCLTGCCFKCCSQCLSFDTL